jgi:hypothetical protein
MASEWSSTTHETYLTNTIKKSGAEKLFLNGDNHILRGVIFQYMTWNVTLYHSKWKPQYLVSPTLL